MCVNRKYVCVEQRTTTCSFGLAETRTIKRKYPSKNKSSAVRGVPLLHDCFVVASAPADQAALDGKNTRTHPTRVIHGNGQSRGERELSPRKTRYQHLPCTITGILRLQSRVAGRVSSPRKALRLFSLGARRVANGQCQTHANMIAAYRRYFRISSRVPARHVPPRTRDPCT